MTIKQINSLLGTDYKSVKDFGDKVNWYRILRHENLSELFIREFQQTFITEFQHTLCWAYICSYQNLSEPFIREFKDKVSWTLISINQNLSEPFIREFKDKVDWYCISSNQKLSEEFIMEFKNEVHLNRISEYQKLSQEFIREFNLEIDEDNWLYKDAEFKKQAVMKTRLYECHEDYFIAYKAIRVDRYSWYNYQYQYLPNETYDSHCNCTKEENSFGLSGWTKERAKEYRNSGLIVRVRINYEDVGQIVHNDGKIRCFKQTFLE